MLQALAAVTCLLSAEPSSRSLLPAAVGVLSENRVSTARLANEDRCYQLHLSATSVTDDEPRQDRAGHVGFFHSVPNDQPFPRCGAYLGEVGWALFPGAYVHRGTYDPRYFLSRVVFGSEEKIAKLNRVRAEPPKSPKRFAEFVKVTKGIDDECVDGSGAAIGSLYKRWAIKNSYNPGVAENVRFCLVPLDDASCLLYVLARGSAAAAEHWPKHERTTLFVVHLAIENVAPSEKSQPGDVEWWCTRTIERSIELDVLEPFEVVRGDDRDYLFFAHSGLVVVDWKAEATRRVPLPGGELVQAILHDTDRGNTGFAFTENRWFEVKEPLEYHEFQLASPKPDDPLPTLVRAAREVRKIYPAFPKKVGGVPPQKLDPAGGTK
jgi:hypothetical protein